MPSTIDIAIRTTTIVASRISSSSRQPSSLHRGTNRGDGSAIDRLGAAMPVPSVAARLVADRGAEEPREQDLLLVAAGERARLRAGTGRLHRQRLHQRTRSPPLARAEDDRL